jgi:hypothetical protein
VFCLPCSEGNEDLCASCVPRDKLHARYALSPFGTGKPLDFKLRNRIRMTEQKSLLTMDSMNANSKSVLFNTCL